MKIKTIIAGLAGIILAACTENTDLLEKVPVTGGYSLNIKVTDEFAEAATRADYSGFPVTTFETGDAIGIYAFNGSSYVKSNVRFVKQSDGTWLSDEDVIYNSSWIYYAYFPYRPTSYTPSSSGEPEDIDTKFATFISDANNYFWQADQSTKAGFTYSNLMLAKGTITDTDDNVVTVKFTMKHKRGLAMIFGDIPSYRISDNIPYTINDINYFLIKPDNSTNVAGFNFETKSGYITNAEYGPEHEYLTFIALEDGTFSFNIYNSSNKIISVSYSIDNGQTWTESNLSSVSSITITTPTIIAGNKILWKGQGSAYNSCRFSSTGRYEIRGNIMSILYGDNFIGKYKFSTDNAFISLFSNNYKLIKSHQLILPAQTLSIYCYKQMFYGCTSLTTAPELPATTLVPSCYSGMFKNCTSLTTAPELPATTLASNCYNFMFDGCTSLTTAPELPATTLASNCYLYMFNNCTSLTTAPELPVMTLANQCYGNMFRGCTSLTTAPELPATTLAEYCYSDMFYGCTSLTTAPELPATTLEQYCYYEMFKNCTSLTTAPELPAITLANQCYRGMFNGCTRLQYIKAAFTSTPYPSYTVDWVKNVSSSGIFVKNNAATWTQDGVNGIPSGWTVETYTP